jgi:cytochrome c
MRYPLLLAASTVLLVCLSRGAVADAAGDPQKGHRLFAQCGSCHTIEADGPTKVGPNLHGVLGRKAGSLAGFDYSAALRTSGIVWDEAKLDQFIHQPAAFVSGTKMAFPGIQDAQQRADIIAYIEQRAAAVP